MTAERNRRCVWSLFYSYYRKDAVCEVCVRTVRYCGNTTDLIKGLRFNLNTAKDEVMQWQSKEEEKKGAAGVRQTSIRVVRRWRARFRETEAVAVGDFDHRHWPLHSYSCLSSLHFPWYWIGKEISGIIHHYLVQHKALHSSVFHLMLLHPSNLV